MRLWVRSGVQINLSFGFSRAVGSASDTSNDKVLYQTIVRRTGKASRSIPCPSIATTRESTRHREASSSFRAAQIWRQGLLNPILRANSCPEVTDLCCRLPLPTSLCGPEAANLPDGTVRTSRSVLWLFTRTCTRIGHPDKVLYQPIKPIGPLCVRSPLPLGGSACPLSPLGGCVILLSPEVGACPLLPLCENACPLCVCLLLPLGWSGCVPPPVVCVCVCHIGLRVRGRPLYTCAVWFSFAEWQLISFFDSLFDFLMLLKNNLKSHNVKMILCPKTNWFFNLMFGGSSVHFSLLFLWLWLNLIWFICCWFLFFIWTTNSVIG